jgi:hypothetical protein
MVPSKPSGPSDSGDRGDAAICVRSNDAAIASRANDDSRGVSFRWQAGRHRACGRGLEASLRVLVVATARTCHASPRGLIATLMISEI